LGFTRHQSSQTCLDGQLRRAPPAPGVQPRVHGSLGPAIAHQPARAVNHQEDLSVKLRRLRKSSNLIRWVLKAAHFSFAEAFIKFLKECVNKNDVQSWTGLLTFAYTAFSTQDATEKRKVSLAIMVKNNLIRITDPPSVCKKKSIKTPRSTTRKAVERKMLNGNISGAVRILSSDDSVAPHAAGALEILRSKHPQGDPDAVYPPAPDDNPVSNLSPLMKLFKLLVLFQTGPPVAWMVFRSTPEGPHQCVRRRHCHQTDWKSGSISHADPVQKCQPGKFTHAI
jgi:hypothetical protein